MTNYKKSLLSVAAAFALATTAATAGYIPLTSTTTDNKWVLFGASGFVTTGAVSSTPNVFSITDSTANTITDTAKDDVAVSGLLAVNIAKNLGKLKALDAVPIEIRVNTDGIDFVETEPVRTIYVSTTAGDTPSFAFEYKASLEGKTLEYAIDGGTAYDLVINDNNTYDNPITGTPITGIAAEDGIAMEDLTGTNSAMDYDFSDNPILASQYVAATHRTAIGDGRARLYSYDATTSAWGTYDTENTVDTNNFQKLVKGKAYWGKIDTNTTSATSAAEAGLVLESATLTAANYITAGLADGWNLLAFDDSSTEIKKASTGMLLDVSFTAEDNVTIIDSSGNHEIVINFKAANVATVSDVAKHINSVVEEKKIKGLLPHTFDLKAFPATKGIYDLALISNKRFTVLNKDTTVAIDGGTTLAGNSLWDIATNAKIDYSGTQFPTTGVRSLYGEYSMIINPLTDAGTASDLALGATLNINVYDSTTNAYGTSDESVSIAGTNADVITSITANADLSDIKPAEINLDLNGTMGEVLLSSLNPFYVRDNTFSRAFKYVDTDSVGTIKITGSGGTTAIPDQTIPDAATASAAATNINGVGEISAGSPSDETDNIIFIVDNDKASEFYIAETTGDHLTYAKSASDMAKGAVKGVYSLGSLAKKSLTHNVEINITEVPDRNDSIRFDYVTHYGTTTGTVIYPNITGTNLDSTEGTPTDNKTLLDAYVTQINADLSAAGITATASHNLPTAVVTTAAGDLNVSLITISGQEVIDITTTLVNDVADANETFYTTFTTGGSDDSNLSTATFEGIVMELNASITSGLVPDLNGSSEYIAAAFIEQYDANGSGSFVVTSDDNITLKFVQKVAAAFTDFDFADIAWANITVAPTGTDANVTVQGVSPSTAEANVTDTQDLGYLLNTNADLAEDLKYNTIYSPNYVMDGPVFTLMEAGYRLQGLVTGTMDLVDGFVDWDSVDLTRPPSEWLNSQDYNLFDTDDRAGYWAKLDSTGIVAKSDPSYVSPITIGTATLSTNFRHHFDSATSTLDGDKTYNYYSGNLSITIAGIDYTIDDGKSARVTASINGKKTELVRDGSTTTYTGKISIYETDGISMNTNHDITINVSDGLGNKLEQVLASTTFDNSKPAAPTVTVNGVGLDITTDDTTVAGFYVFDNTIPESGTISAAKVASATPAITNICKDLAAVDYTSTEGSIKVISVDGTGILNQGNASDATSVPFMPILKDRVYVTDAHSSGLPVVTTGGDVYDVNCETSATLTVSTGVTISTITEGKVTKLAYTSLGEDSSQAAPIALYLTNGKTPEVITQITYPDAYIGKDVFISIDGQAYNYQLLDRATAELTSSSNPTDISGQALTDISF